MTSNCKAALVILALAASGEAFSANQALWSQRTVTSTGKDLVATTSSSASPSLEHKEAPFFIDIKVQQDERPVTASPAVMQVLSPPESPVPKKRAGLKNKQAGAAHKEGVLSPIVMATKTVMGDEKLNQVRGKVISVHSNVIKNFVETSETPLGRAALVRLFSLADRNGDGKLDKDEISDALRKLGFTWLQEKQVNGILKRADLDKNGTIEFDEFLKEAPKTLKTNLVKLAKKNGGEMGLLV